MIVWLVLMLAAVVICAAALVMTIINLAHYRPPPAVREGAAPAPLVSVCIPARDEEANLAEVVRSVLASEHAAIEVLVYDDESADATPRILRDLVDADARVRAVATVPLPAGWVGKQHACHRMAQAARGEWLLFTDADVRFAPDAVGRSVAAARTLDASLVSTFPREVAASPGEALLVPLIHFMLFSYLPMPRMRRSDDPAASAGCGQFLLLTRGAYEASGGHAAVRDSMHEGIKLPRLVRKAGHRTDLFDGTELLWCRMYRGLGETWRGFAKNAYEGLGSIWLLLLLTAMHVVGHLLPWVVVGLAATGVESTRLAAPPAVAAITIAYLQRALLARRFRQPPLGVLLHPIGVAAMTVLQWQSYLMARAGRRSWRGRTALLDS